MGPDQPIARMSSTILTIAEGRVEFGFHSKSPSGDQSGGPRNQMVIGPDPARGELALRGRSRQSFALTPLSFRWTAATWSRVPRVDSRGGHHHCYHHGSANVRAQPLDELGIRTSRKL